MVLAFDRPPQRWGFRPNKAGSCWWRRIAGKKWAIELGRQLAAIDIHGVIKRAKPSRVRTGRSLMPLECKYPPAGASGPQPAAITIRPGLSRAGGRRTYDQIHSKR